MEVVQSSGIALRPVGFFEELGLAGHYAGKIRDVARKRAAPNERDVVSYLRGGYVLLDATESATDVIAGETRITGSSSLISDGTWVWRLDLPYYVERYHLSLPGDFMAHLTSLNFVMPEIPESYLAAITAEAIKYF